MDQNPYAAPKEETVTTNYDGIRRTSSPYGPYREITGLGHSILVFLGLGIVAAIAQIYALFRVNKANALFSDDPATEEMIDQWVETSTLIGFGEALLFVTTVILWCVWKNKSCKNAWLFQTHSIQSPLTSSLSSYDTVTPGWAVGYYFIPIANLWKPLEAMMFIRNQVSDVFKSGPVLGLWWATWLAKFFASRYYSRNVEFTTSEQIKNYNEGLMISEGITIVASLFAAHLIFQLTVAQNKTADERKLRLVKNS